MGQTLTHGVYLPDEGERNCYNGLAANWSILDGAVGTVAEHTTQIAGKAPAVHTHGNITNDGKVGTTANKPLITGTGGVVQAGSFGNQANTFCEGNDSRLSDARTPVAHTHSKTDVTDLFNSANTWSENNTFSSYITLKESAAIPASGFGKGIAFRDYQNNRLGYIQPYLTSNSEKRLVIGADSGDVASNSNLIPNANNSVNLGSSSYQWNNLYAKNYYYNGTPWGLDKANTWSAINSYSAGIKLQGSRTAYILPEFAASYSGLSLLTYNALGSVKIGVFTESNNTPVLDTTKGYLSVTTGEVNSANIVRLEPVHGDTADLGTSTNKWKSLNGINPGALSLPNLDSAVSLTTILQAAIDKTQTTNSWTANFTGILCINWITKNLTGPFRCSVYNASDIKNATWGQTFWADNVWYFIVSFPVQNGKTYYFDNTFTRTSEDSAHIVHSANAIYTLGNV